MPASFRAQENLPLPGRTLGPIGPFPRIDLQSTLERRWLHYALLSSDGEFGMVANIAALGPMDGKQATRRNTSILLLHKRDRGWRASQYNAITHLPLWSAFEQPHAHGEERALVLAATTQQQAIDLSLARSSRPCTSQCAPFARDQHLRWQSETGVISHGTWTFDGAATTGVEAIGYHERVRGNWGWPELGGWVFGFANDPQRDAGGSAPCSAVVFTLIQPPRPKDAATASVMLWRSGRMLRHFPRRCVTVAVRGELDRDRVAQVPAMANLFGVPPMSPIPERLVIAARMGHDHVTLDFACEEAARIVIPSETGIRPFSVHEVIGPVEVTGRTGGQSFAFRTRGIVEFAGGAGGD